MATEKEAHKSPASASASASITTKTFEEIFYVNSSNILSTCISLPNPSSKLVIDTLSSLNSVIHHNDSKPMTTEILKGTNIGDAMAYTVQKYEEMKRKMLATNLNAVATEEYTNWDRALNMAGGIVKEFLVIAREDKKKHTQIELQIASATATGPNKS